MKRISCCLALAFAFTSPALAQAPAARVSDLTSHGGTIVGPGAPNVFIEGKPAAVLGDQTTCPLTDGASTPHVGGPIVTASSTVLIGGKPAARVGDANAETGSSATIVSGSPTVAIGN